MSSETSSVDKSEPLAPLPCDSEPVAPSVKPAVKKAKKSKTKVKAVVAAVVATQATEEENMNTLSVDHPYLSVLYKRMRSHRKKLEKIKNLEQARTYEGKVLNAQQLELMTHKPSLEKLLVELEMLREQFVGVFGQELEQKQQEQLKKEEEAVEAAAEQLEQTEEAEKEEQDEQVAEQEERAPEETQETLEKEEKEDVDEFANVYELLKTLHLVNLHQALGKEVPMVLDFFSKVLLGNTRPPAELAYEENLMDSLEEAKKYLSKSDKVFACDTTYSGLRAFVDELAKISSGKKEEAEVEVAEEEEEVEQPLEDVEETPDVPVVPAEINLMPQISFFTDSQLESEQSDEAITEEEQVQVTEPVAVETAEEPVEEMIENDQVETQEVPVAAPAPESVPAPPLSFAAVAAGASSERTPSPSASSGSSTNEKKEDNSPRDKNPRRRGQGRWREKGSTSSSGDKSGNGSPTNGGKPRRTRAPRKNDENNGEKRTGSKEGRRPRIDRGLRKQGDASEQHATPMIAPHA